MKKISIISNLIIIIISFVSCGSSEDQQQVSNSDQTSDVNIPASTVPSDKSYDFSLDGPLVNFVTNNIKDLPDVVTVAGRYRANLIDNTNDITLHYNSMQGRLDAKLLSFPFVFIARNIGIGIQKDSQVAHTSNGNSFIFSGVQIHVRDFNSLNSSHIVVGHRGRKPFTIEGKNTVDGVSTVDDIGANVVPLGRADIRVVGNVDQSITI